MHTFPSAAEKNWEVKLCECKDYLIAKYVIDYEFSFIIGPWFWMVLVWQSESVQDADHFLFCIFIGAVACFS